MRGILHSSSLRMKDVNMRRKDREISDRGKIEEILMRNRLCHIAFSDEPVPYVIPMSYGYADTSIFMHCAVEGKKLELLKKNPRVGFCIARERELLTGELACDWGVDFESVVGSGVLEIVEDRDERIRGLKALMGQFSADRDWEFSDRILGKTVVLALRIEEMSGKASS